jgi:hypothetical protein
VRHRGDSLIRLDGLVGALGPGPWSLGDVEREGWTRGQIRAAVTAGRLTRPRRGVLAAAVSSPADVVGDVGVRTGANLRRSAVSDFDLAAVTAALMTTTARAAASHQSAARVHGQWAPRDSPHAHLTAPGQPDALVDGVRVHGSRLPPELVTVVGRIAVTTIARTAVDLARGRTFPEALVALDGGARLICTRTFAVTERALRGQRQRALWAPVAGDLLAVAYDSVRTWPGTVVVREALEHVDPGSESPFESRSRGWILDAGLPSPAVAYRVAGASGAVYFADLAWPELRVLGEADGIGKYGEESAEVRRRLRAERRRQRDLEDAGWTVVRWDSTESPTTVTARIQRALRSPSNRSNGR